MEPPDVAKLIDANSNKEVQQARADAETAERLSSEAVVLLAQRGKGARSGHNMNPAETLGEVKDYGQIKDMDLPDAWQESREEFRSSIGTRSFRMFNPPGAPDAALCFYYRGLPASDETGNHFRDLLDKPPHALSLQELASISEVLRDKKKPEDFTITSAKTEDVNGKRVLVVEGRYNERGHDTRAMFVDAAGDGRVIQEVYFQAPKDQYPQFAPAAKAAMDSIRWR